MGTGPFAVPAFVSLVKSPHEVAALFTRPIRHVRGRGKSPDQPARDAAQEHGVVIFDPEDINAVEAQQQLLEFEPDLFFVCDYGQILSAETLGIARLGGVNLHGSLLPKYRGAAPVHWAIYHGEEATGVSVIHMTPRLDAGPILSRLQTPIDPRESMPELESRLAVLGVEAVEKAIAELSEWDGDTAIGEVQDKSQATRAPRLKKQDGAIDWTRTAQEIANQIRAFKPWPATFTHLLHEGKPPLRLIVDTAEPCPADASVESPAGTVAGVESDTIIVATGAGLLALRKLQPAGKRVMTAQEFLRGHAVNVGDRFE